MKNLKKEQFIKDLTKLVSCQTITTDLKSNNKILDFIETKINKQAIIKHIKNNGVESFIACNKKTKKPEIGFLVHADVVAGRQDQFRLKIKKKLAYGRGVSDMKFSIPIGYTLLNNLIESRSPLSFALIITTDEEHGGFNGAKYLVEKYKLKPKILIVPDGGDNFIFVDKAKGVCALKIEATGIPAHSSRIWEGKNAIEPIIKFCQVVLKKYGPNNQKESWKTTMNIGKIYGGISANQVCPEASAILDFRFPETNSFEKIFDELKKLAKKIDPALKISEYSRGFPTLVNRNDKIVKLFIKNIEKKLEQKIKIKGTYGASDARHFSCLNIPVLMIKPFGGDIHGDNEWLDIDSCLIFYQAIWDFLQELQNKKII